MATTETVCGSTPIMALLSALAEFGTRMKADLELVFFTDGSGHVMAPMHDYGDGAKRSAVDGSEPVFGFDSLDELGTYLAGSELEPKVRCRECGKVQPRMGLMCGCEECDGNVEPIAAGEACGSKDRE